MAYSVSDLPLTGILPDGFWATALGPGGVHLLWREIRPDRNSAGGSSGSGLRYRFNYFWELRNMAKKREVMPRTVDNPFIELGRQAEEIVSLKDDLRAATRQQKACEKRCRLMEARVGGEPCDRCGKTNLPPIHTCTASKYVSDLEIKLAKAEKLIRAIERDAENATEYVLCTMYDQRGNEIKALQKAIVEFLFLSEF